LSSNSWQGLNERYRSAHLQAPPPPFYPSQKPAAYRVLARKYRPKDFSDLMVGQEPMVRTLTNAFETGRIAQAYMLTGVRGVGKTTTARILARALNYKTAEIDKPTIDLQRSPANIARRSWTAAMST
jgi:replication-associated recombination protein RarA